MMLARTTLRSLAQNAPAAPAPTPGAEPLPVEVDERRAVELAIHGSFVERMAVAAKALRGLLKDPTDTRQVFVLYLVVNRPNVPHIFLTFQHIGILSLEFHVDKLSRPLL